MIDSTLSTGFALVVEDRPSERAKIKQALSILNLDCRYAVNTEQAMSYKEDDNVILLVLDLYLPPNHDPRNTLEFMRDFRKARPEVPIIILTVHDPRPEELREVVTARAGYFYRKAGDEDFELEELASLFRLAIGGAISFSFEIASSLPDLVEFAFRQDDPLTPREWSILVLIEKNLTNDMIAQRLLLSTAAVRSHRKNILDKLEKRGLIASRTESALIQWFRENRLRYRQ